MRKWVTILTISLTLIALTALAGERPKVGVRAQAPKVGVIKGNLVPNAGDQVIDILMGHPNWERNNVKVPGVYRADKVKVHVRAEDGIFKYKPVDKVSSAQPTFTITTGRAFTVIGPVTGRTQPGDQRPTYTFRIEFENRGEGLTHLYNATIMDYKGTWLLYLYEPGAEDWTEEWIMK